MKKPCQSVLLFISEFPQEIHYLDSLHGKIQTRDHEMSTENGGHAKFQKVKLKMAAILNWVKIETSNFHHQFYFTKVFQMMCHKPWGLNIFFVTPLLFGPLRRSIKNCVSPWLVTHHLKGLGKRKLMVKIRGLYLNPI